MLCWVDFMIEFNKKIASKQRKNHEILERTNKMNKRLEELMDEFSHTDT